MEHWDVVKTVGIHTKSHPKNTDGLLHEANDNSVSQSEYTKQR